MARIVLIFI